MKIGTSITRKKILEALPYIEKDHGDKALRVAGLIKKLCHCDDAEEFYDLLLSEIGLFPARQFPRRDDFMSSYRPNFWWETSLEYIDKLLQTHGVEGLSTEDYSCYHCVAQYCNAGDTYAPTIYWDNIKKDFYIGCWGDIVEYYERTEGWRF